MKIFKILPIVLLACVFAGCSLLNPKSPTQTLKNFVAATQKKDVEIMKKSLSSGTLKMHETLALIKSKTLDETIISSDGVGGSYEKMPETRNEKINGDTATLEVKSEKTGEWDTLYFVKEADEWKIAFDKSLEEMLKKPFGGWKLPNFDDSSSTEEKPSTDQKQ